MDVFGTGSRVSIDHEKPGIAHVFYDNDDPLIDATLDLRSGEVVYLRDRYSSAEHEVNLHEVEELLTQEEDEEYNLVEEVYSYARD